MDWSTARNKLLSLARRRPLSEAPVSVGSNGARARIVAVPGLSTNGRPTLRLERTPPVRGPRLFAEPFAAPRAASLCIASGKGGTGKSVVTASLATFFGGVGKTLLIDADLGVGNAHILQNITPERSLVDLIEGGVPIEDVIYACGGNVDLIGAGSGIPRMSELSQNELHLVATGVERVEPDYKTLLVDSAAGISFQTLRFASACDIVLVVTTPDLTAMTDAYAFFKVLKNQRPDLKPLLLVNRAPNERVARGTADRIGKVARRFLGGVPTLVGWCPEDPEVRRCVNEREPVLLGAPASPFSCAIRTVGVRLIEELARAHPSGFGHRLAKETEIRAT